MGAICYQFTFYGQFTPFLGTPTLPQYRSLEAGHWQGHFTFIADEVPGAASGDAVILSYSSLGKTM